MFGKGYQVWLSIPPPELAPKTPHRRARHRTAAVTAAGHSELDQSPEFNTQTENCPVRNVLSRALGKWHMLILYELSRGPLRFNALRRAIGDVTQRVLTENLRSLERDGYLNREVNPNPPVAVTYSLTPLGQELAVLQFDLMKWAVTRMPQVDAARSSFDNNG